MKRMLLLMVMFASGCIGPGAGSETDFDFVIRKVTQNYSGYADKVTSTNKAALMALTEEQRQEFRTASDADAEGKALGKWIAFFRDRHLTVSRPTTVSTATGKSEEPPSLTIVDAATIIIRVPSFDISFAGKLDALLDKHRNALSATPRLILDLRGNGGGSDYCFQGLLPYVYTRPIEEHGAEMWATEDNVQCLRDAQKEDGVPPEAKQMLGHLADLMSTNKGTFVEYAPKTVIRMDDVYANPKRVAILIDKACGSSTEQFLLYALQSSKVLLFGENTAGAIDYANVFSVPTPSKRWVLNYPISRSKRLPDHPVDSHGISPHIRLDSSVKDKIRHIIEYLNREEAEQSAAPLPPAPKTGPLEGAR
jgi:hypothetical protein